MDTMRAGARADRLRSTTVPTPADAGRAAQSGHSSAAILPRRRSWSALDLKGWLFVPPFLAQIEYHALPQFALPGHVVDLRQLGFDALADDFTPSDWESAHVGGGLYALPQGGCPMVLFYNKRVFDEHGLTVPTTWDEFAAEARKLKDADPTKYITSDPGDAGFLLAMIWQAGGRPFAVDGDQITIDFENEGTQRWLSTWNQLLEDDHLAPFPHWTEEWFRALSDGTIATLRFGGWMAGIMAGFEDGAGDWRAAPMPTYDGGQPVSSHHGGTNQAVLEQSENPELAAGFLRWLNHGEGATIYRQLGCCCERDW